MIHLKPKNKINYSGGKQEHPHQNIYGFIFSDDISKWMTSNQVSKSVAYKNAKPLF